MIIWMMINKMFQPAKCSLKVKVAKWKIVACKIQQRPGKLTCTTKFLFYYYYHS